MSEPFDIRWLFGGEKDAETQKSYLESLRGKGKPLVLTVDFSRPAFEDLMEAIDDLEAIENKGGDDS